MDIFILEGMRYMNLCHFGQGLRVTTDNGCGFVQLCGYIQTLQYVCLLPTAHTIVYYLQVGQIDKSIVCGNDLAKTRPTQYPNLFSGLQFPPGTVFQLIHVTIVILAQQRYDFNEHLYIRGFLCTFEYVFVEIPS